MLKTFKGKAFALGLGCVALASSASAAITVSDTGVMSGSLELGPFYAACGVVLTALGAIVAVRAGIKLFKTGI